MAGTSNNLRKLKTASDRYNKNITKRGTLAREEKPDKPSVGPYVLGLITFILVASTILQMIQNVRHSPL